MSEGPYLVGMDGAQGHLEMALRPSGERGAVPHDASGGTTLVDRLQAFRPTLLVLAAPGGLECGVPSALATAGRPGVVVHPRQVRDGARATGQVATTDAVDARALAPFAAVIRPPPRPLPAAPTQERRALLGRRQQRIGRRTAQQHRLVGPSGRLQTDMAAHSTGCNERLSTLDDALETLRRASPRWREHDARWQSAPGLGPVCARPLRLERPAWGTLTRQQSAALVGVAPRNGDRGTRRGRRPMWGGRAHVRTVLYLGSLVAPRDHPRSTACYARLLAAGTGKKVALTACLQQFLPMLHAMLKHRTPWQTQEGQHEKNRQGPLDNQDSCSAPASLRLPAAPEAQCSALRAGENPQATRL